MANEDTGFFTCKNTCWIVGGLLGLVALLLLWGAGWFLAIIVGIVVAVAVAFVLMKLFCSDVPAQAAAPSTSSSASAASTASTSPAAKADTEATPKAEAAAASAAMGNPDAAAVPPEPKSDDAPAKTEDAPKDVASQTVGSSKVKPSKELKGSKELAERKGDYKYEKPAETKKPAAKKAAAKKPAAKSAAKAAPVASSGADDLKLIKGVGPGIEKKLHDAGITTYAQIAAWTDADVAEMDDKLNFRGRIARDEWISQADKLAKGEETEFSKRASSSGLYEGNKDK
ncbi:hypothetical protein [Maritimibacter dapengensis]|uniref:NADH-quinone oxidoreductase subunit E n=1 Tax=Maritimibacter dapengensis TaxID=2836868 RepID=A0ABS6T1J2_9RHOB|nr:hypothetical protein [Maritimibacter dapengensis]MBV7379108.1 hypothetical protein [Maritimibacter dapengensis]